MFTWVNTHNSHVFSVPPRSLVAMATFKHALKIKYITKTNKKCMKIQLTIALNQWEPWACFCATRRSHLGVIMSSLLRNLVFVFAAVICDMISSSWSSSCADTLDSRGLLINGSRIHSLAVRGSFQQRRLFFTHFASWFGYWRVSQCILKRQEWMIDGCDGENPVIFQDKTTFRLSW